MNHKMAASLVGAVECAMEQWVSEEGGGFSRVNPAIIRVKGGYEYGSALDGAKAVCKLEGPQPFGWWTPDDKQEVPGFALRFADENADSFLDSEDVLGIPDDWKEEEAAEEAPKEEGV